MKHFWKRLTAMVAALMLLCTCALAQDGTLLLTGQAPEVCMPPYYNKGETVVQGSRGMRFCAGCGQTAK